MDYKRLSRITGSEDGSRYRQIRTALGRFGFAPNGRSDDSWDFHFIDYNWGNHTSGAWYDVQIYLDNDGSELGEYRLTCVGGNSEEIDETFSTFEDLLSRIRELKKINKVK